jgi:hypothetical protein
MLIFTAALMLGVQLPNFVDQYVKRIEAHLKEAQIQYNEYLKIAQRFPEGTIERLIEKHEQSQDLTFRAEAEPLKNTVQRKNFYESEINALQGSFWSQTWHILSSPDQEIIKDTYYSYTANLPLNSDAAICGLTFGLLASLILEFFWSTFMRLFRRPKKRSKPKAKAVEVRRAEPYIKP